MTMIVVFSIITYFAIGGALARPVNYWLDKFISGWSGSGVVGAGWLVFWLWPVVILLFAIIPMMAFLHKGMSIIMGIPIEDED